MTGRPRRANSLPVSVLPMPMEPVSAATKTRPAVGSGTPERLQKMSPQARRDGGTNAEPLSKCRHRLMHQHSKAIYRLMARGFGASQQLCFDRVVNDICYRGPFRQGIQRQFK